MLNPTTLSYLGFTLLEQTDKHFLYEKTKIDLTLKIKPYYKDPLLTYGMLTQGSFGIYNGILTEELLLTIMKLNNY